MKRKGNFTFPKIALIPFVLLGLSSCGQEANQQERKGLAQDIKSMQIKRITDTQLATTIDEWGKQIVKLAEKAAKKASKDAKTGHPAYCGQVDSIPALAALQKEYNIQIQLLTPADTANPVLSGKEKELLQAYQYNVKRNLALPDNLQAINDSLYVYNAALNADDEIYKNCYKDQDVQFVLWRIVFNRKDVVKKIDMKVLNQ